MESGLLDGGLGDLLSPLVLSLAVWRGRNRGERNRVEEWGVERGLKVSRVIGLVTRGNKAADIVP